MRLETGTATATDLGHNIVSEFLLTPVADTYTTGSDQMVLEDATVDSGEVKRIQLTNKGTGFTKLPTITIDPARGTKVLDTQGNYDTPSDAALISSTTDIGAIDEIRIIDGGANYVTTDILFCSFLIITFIHISPIVDATNDDNSIEYHI